MSSWMTAAFGMLAMIGQSWELSSADAGRVPMVSLLYCIRWSPARNTVKIRESSDSSSWWKAVSRSSLLNIDFSVNMGMMSSTLGIGR